LAVGRRDKGNLNLDIKIPVIILSDWRGNPEEKADEAEEGLGVMEEDGSVGDQWWMDNGGDSYPIFELRSETRYNYPDQRF
jgi:hypothetical protein